MSTLDKAKLWLVAVLIVGAVYMGFHTQQDFTLQVRAAMFLGGFVLAALVLWFSKPGQDFIVYCRESAGEVRKVVWPTKDETVRTTGVVLLFVVVVAIFLWVVDSIISTLLALISL